MAASSAAGSEVNAGGEIAGRVLLLLAHEANRDQLAEWLGRTHVVVDADERTADLAAVDLCIVDEGGFSAHAAVLEAVERTNPRVFSPVLLVSSRRPSTVTALRPEGIDPGVWEMVDEVIETPISQAELRRRLDVLLRVRRQSVALEYDAQRLNFLNGLLRHEILNAMAVIRPRAELLEERFDDADERRNAGVITKWCDEIVAFVKRIRHLLRAYGAGRDTGVFETVDVVPVVEGVVDRFEETYPDATFVVDASAPAVVLADDLLMDVLINLVRNAVQHNDAAEPAVRVAVDVGPDAIVLTVTDNGPGVPDERKEAIFHRRVEDLHPYNAIGGFGLMFIDAEIGRYGGSVHVEDATPRGARFVVTLPNASSES